MTTKQLSRLLIFLFWAAPLLASASKYDIAYLAHTNGFWQVWTMDVNGDHQQQISISRFDKSHLSWYPDGQHLLVNGNQGQLRKLDVITKKEKPIELPIKGTVDAVVSPSGEQITFSLSVADSIDNNHIWLVDVKTHKLTKITNMAGLQHEPTWSADGKWIYFLSSSGLQSHDIWRVSLNTKSTEQLTLNQLYHFDLTFSLNDEMAFSSNRTGNYEIWLRDTSGKERQITHNESVDSRPSISADGKEVIFESSRDGGMNIYRKTAGGKIKQLTHHEIGARYPVWRQRSKGEI